MVVNVGDPRGEGQHSEPYRFRAPYAHMILYGVFAAILPVLAH